MCQSAGSVRTSPRSHSLLSGRPSKSALHSGAADANLGVGRSRSRTVQCRTGLVDAAIQLVGEQLPLFADAERRLVHTDLHWANLMTDGRSLTAILDFERARPAAADLDLDVLLRFSYWPRLPVAPEYESALHAADFQRVPAWLAEVYPQLLATPHLRERLEVYAVVHDLRQGIQFPDVPGVTKPPSWPWNRLRATLAGDSYLAEWL